MPKHAPIDTINVPMLLTAIRTKLTAWEIQRDQQPEVEGWQQDISDSMWMARIEGLAAAVDIIQELVEKNIKDWEAQYDNHDGV